ncbi:MAG: hypothetical protein H6869_09330 [Rhodospirillales bacterium]|nr:hypothetical protein [Rhodospirillales bacterium]
MGSLASRPQIPQVQQQPVIVTIPAADYYSAPAATSSSTASTASNQGAADTSAATDTAAETGTGSEEATRLAREDNLLRRSRGRLGTVLTGFSGVLSQAARAGRKTLLGE